MRKNPTKEGTMKLKCTISQDKVFKILQWIFFIGFIIASGWFASGVLKQFFSRKTSFSQHQEKVKNYPVVNIILGHPVSEVNPSDAGFQTMLNPTHIYTVKKGCENRISHICLF